MVTVNGAHVFVEEGQSVEDAVNNKFSKSSTPIENKTQNETNKKQLSNIRFFKNDAKGAVENYQHALSVNKRMLENKNLSPEEKKRYQANINTLTKDLEYYKGRYEYYSNKEKELISNPGKSEPVEDYAAVYHTKK